MNLGGESFGGGPTSAMGLGRVKTPTFNLRVEIPSRFRKFENQKCLRPLLREDDRENNSAHSWLLHVFTQPGSKGEILARSRCFPLYPRKRTQVGHPVMSVSCQQRKWDVKSNEVQTIFVRGSLSLKEAPPLSRFSAHICPLCASTMV